MEFATYTLDDNYLYPFIVSSFSVRKHSNLVIRILQCPDAGLGLTENGLKNATHILKSLDIPYEVVNIVLPKNSNHDFPIWDRFPASTWIRFLALFDSQFLGEKMFYLEPDVLLTSEFSLPVHEAKVISARAVPGHQDEESRWNGPSGNWYFNCGVMFVNVSKWQESYSAAEFWQIVANHKILNFRIIDQDSINYLVKGRQESLPIEFNSFPSEYEENVTRVIHFAGGAKPWIYSNGLTRTKLPKQSRKALKEWDSIAREMMNNLRDNEHSIEILTKSSKVLKPSLRRQFTLMFPKIANNPFLYGVFRAISK